MTLSRVALSSLRQDLDQLISRLETVPHGDLIYQALQLFLDIADEELERLDWKILRSCLRDMHQALRVFAPYRHTRKISIFGSARTPSTAPVYEMAVRFAQAASAMGFMIITGAGGGIMEAGNKGAGPNKSFGLNIELPFEQGANPYIEGDPRLIHFKYFFTRKLFLLKETDAIAVFPGGFGTQDEAFECLTLCQTGKAPPKPLVLMDVPGGTYWQHWDQFIHQELAAKGLINGEDQELYRICTSVEEGLAYLSGFYRVYHSSRYVGDRLVLRLNQDISDAALAELNRDFRDILVSGQIERTEPLPREVEDEQPINRPALTHTLHLPRLILHFNQRDYSRLYQLIYRLNGFATAEAVYHPELK